MKLKLIYQNQVPIVVIMDLALDRFNAANIYHSILWHTTSDDTALVVDLSKLQRIDEEGSNTLTRLAKKDDLVLFAGLQPKLIEYLDVMVAQRFFSSVDYAVGLYSKEHIKEYDAESTVVSLLLQNGFL